MGQSYTGELEQVLAQYRSRRAEAGELQGRIRAITATAVAPRQTVKVTVGAQGELSGIEFPTGAYKRMAPNELAEAILGAVREARAKALDAVRELMAPELPAGLNFMELLEGTADVARTLPKDPPMLDLVRDYVDSGRIAAPGRAAVDG